MPIAINFSPQTIISLTTKPVNVLNTLINFEVQKLCNHVTSPFILKTITILKKQFNQFQWHYSITLNKFLVRSLGLHSHICMFPRSHGAWSSMFKPELSYPGGKAKPSTVPTALCSMGCCPASDLLAHQTVLLPHATVQLTKLNTFTVISAALKQV